MGFVSERDLVVGESYGFTLLLPETNAVVLGYGSVRNKAEHGRKFRYGAQFLFHPEDEQSMAKYVEKGDREIIELLKEIS
jgi:hypothetical protein